MAKVTAPLFSFGASGKLANALVYFPWKGINAVRSYVVPSNPDTVDQGVVRGNLTAVVAKVHEVQAQAVDPMVADDQVAYSLWASVFASPRTWFNQLCSNWLIQKAAALLGCIYSAGAATPGDGTLALTLTINDEGPTNHVTAGTFFWGTSKTALINQEAAVVALGVATGSLTALTNGKKYYWQFRPTTHVSYVGAYSGIYVGIPAA